MEINDALQSHQLERSEVMPSPPDAPQPAQLTTDKEPVPQAGDIPILRLNQKKDAPQNVYESLRDHQQSRSEKLRLLHT
jgi:hypothetical protein